MVKTVARGLIDCLLETAKARRTGVLRFECGTSKKQLVLRDGLVVFAESNLQEEHLARTLLKANLLKRTHLPLVAAQMKSGKAADESILACSALDAAALKSGAVDQAVTILASVFEWTEYQTHFYPGEALVRRSTDLQLPLLELLVMAARRAVSRHLLPDDRGKLKGSVSPAESRRDELLKLPLNGAEGFALSLIKEKTSVENLLPLLSSTASNPEELIKLLALLGFLRLEASATIAEAAPPTAVESTSEHLEKLLRQFELSSLYEILAVSPDSTDAEIKQAYHVLAKRYHPDRFQSDGFGPEIRILAEQLFTYITGAYATLGSPGTRSAYDETRLKKESQVEAALKARSVADAEREEMARTLYRAGRMSLSKGDFERAAQQFKECVWLRPDVARYQHFLGLAQAEIPRLRKEAEQHLLKSLDLDQTRIESHLALGKLYMEGNLLRRAEAHLNKALSWDRGNPEALRLLAEIASQAAAKKTISRRLRESLDR